MIPFEKHHASGSTTRLCVEGEHAYASQLTDGDFRPAQDVCIMQLEPDQALELEVQFEEGSGATHAKFSHVGAIGYRLAPAGHIEMHFELITDASPIEYLRDAVASIRQRVRDARACATGSYRTIATERPLT